MLISKFCYFERDEKGGKFFSPLEFAKLATNRRSETVLVMRRALAVLLALIMVMGLAACGSSDQVVEVPAPEDMTLEFLQEHAESKGHHDWEGDIYLMQPYVFAVRENGEVACIFEGAMDVLEVGYTYVGEDRIPRDDGIMVLNLHGYLMLGNSSAGWKSMNP